MGIPHRVICAVSKGPFYHVGIAFWIRDARAERRLMLLHAERPGLRVVSLSSRKDATMTVLRTRARWEEFGASCLDWAGTLPYGWADLLAIALNERWGMNIPNLSRGQVCSEFVARRLDYHYPDLQGMCSPNGLFRALLPDSFLVGVSLS